MTSEYAVVPYCEIDGVRNYSDTFIKGLFDRMALEGTAGSVFMGSGINDAQAFLDMAKSPGTYLYVLYCGEEPAGIAWLNRLQYRWAQLHFCTFKPVWGRKTIALGKHTLRELLHMGGPGRYVLDMLVGIIPSRNRVGLSYVKKCGGVVSGTLPKGIFNPHTGESEEATIITLTREGLE